MKLDDLRAEMRLAFTRATVAFPRLNMHPISIAVYHVFTDVFHDLKGRYREKIVWSLDPYNVELNETMTVFVDQARILLLPRGVAEEVTIGMPTLKAKAVAQLVAGLNLSEARTLLLFAESSKDKNAISERRLMMLRVHRNTAANNLARDAYSTARKYFLNGVADGKLDAG